MASNGISTLATKELRQIAKLDLAAAKRGESYDIDLLPTKYDGNSIINNPNPGGLQPHRPWTAGSPPPSGNDFGFTGDQNMWVINGGFNAGSIFSDPAPTNPAYTYPDNSYTGKTYNFDGTSYMIGTNLAIGGAWQSNTITIDFWFLPTAKGVQLLTELGQQNFVSPGVAGYHTTLLEINSDGNIKARFWQNKIPGDLITSTNTVDLNKWNHIYFTEASIGVHKLELNGVPTTGNPTYTRYNPLTTSNTNIHYAVGGSESQNMGNAGGFQGKIGYLNIHDYPVESTWTNTKTRFRPTTYALSTAGSVTSIDEGAALTFNVTTTNVVDGTVLTWTTDRNPTDAGGYPIEANRFSPADSGQVTINNNTGTFTVTISADSFTAPLPQLYNIVVAGSNTLLITVNDTSQTPPVPSSNQVISLNPNYIVTNGGTSIPNDADEGSTSATVAGTFTSSSAQGGTLTFNSMDSRIILPAKNIKTIGIWIKLLNPAIHPVAYLLDSRLHDVFLAGSGSGYFYSGGIEDWTLLSINGAPADNSSWAAVVTNVNVWQYVTVISQTTKTDSISLFSRYTHDESLFEFQVGRIEAWDYIQLDSQIAAAYASHSSNYV